ncbi:putative short-chain dehydrogenase [Biscogniauxia marginata]|nr:putative short-chain dehydrogenase [Biscogniauxia marginata]
MPDPFAPYAELYVNPQGPGDKRPTALKILDDNDLFGAWSDKVVIITGATSGIGVETARAMYATGARVFLMVRNTHKATSIVADIISSTKGRGNIDVIEMDNDSLDSVRKAAREFLSMSSQLNVLINNTAVMACPKTTTIDGFERQFAVNYLAHFTLSVLLLPTMMRSSSESFNSRIVWVSSSGHRWCTVKFDDINFDKDYEPFLAYGQSKTATNWASNYIDRAYGPRGVHSLALDPGGVWSNLQRYASEEKQSEWKKDLVTMIQMQSPEQGAATSIWAATAPVWEGRGGKYLANCKLAGPSTNLTSPIDDGYAPHCYDLEGEDRLWKLSLDMAGLKAP